MDENGAIHVPKRPLNEILNISEGGAKKCRLPEKTRYKHNFNKRGLRGYCIFYFPWELL